MFSETTSRSWFSRLGGGFRNIIFGLLLLVAAGVLLFWNEGRAVKTYKALKEGAGIVVSVPAETLNAANDGKLVHVSGPLSYPGRLADPLLGVSIPALRLKRHVEMLQWREETSTTTRKKIGGGTETTTTYSYRKVWSAALIASSGFKQPQGHENPLSMPIASADWTAQDARLGAFILPASLAATLGTETPVPLSKENRPKKSIAGKGRVDGQGVMYFGSRSRERIGDMRVSLKAARPAEASIVAMQKGKSLAPYKTGAGREILLARASLAPAAEMFAGALRENKVLTWLLRGVGLAGMFIAFAMIFSILRVIADIVPIFGSLVGAGLSMVSLLLALALSFIVIAIAWLFFRPLLSLALLAAALAALWLARTKLKKAPSPAPEKT